MKKPPSSSARLRRNRAARRLAGFTLVEVLVSTTVLILIIAILAQVVGNATTSIQRSTKGMDSNQLATLALDRIGDSIARMVSSGEGTLVAIKNPNGSDGLAMITNARVRSRPSGSKVSVDDFTDIRLGARGFCIISAPDPDLTASGGTYPKVPMLHWGDGTVSWSAQTATNVQGDLSQALLLATTDVQDQISSPGATPKLLQFTPLSRSICRLELAFLLSDGTTVSGSGSNLPLQAGFGGTPAPLPRNKYFVPGEVFTSPPVQFTAPAYPLAFNSADSDAASTQTNSPNVYVSAVIVGIATLDQNTQRILSNTQFATLASTLTLQKTLDNSTPIQTWDISGPTKTTYAKLQSPNFPPAVLQNIRFTQKSFYVH